MNPQLPAAEVTEYVRKKLTDPTVHWESLMQMTQLPELGQVLNVYMGKRDMSTTALFERAGLNSKYGFRVMKGERMPSRDVLLRLAFVLELDYEQTQYLLKCGEEAPLSGRRARDVAIMKALEEHMDLMDVEDMLIDHDLEPLIRG